MCVCTGWMTLSMTIYLTFCSLIVLRFLRGQMTNFVVKVLYCIRSCKFLNVKNVFQNGRNKKNNFPEIFQNKTPRELSAFTIEAVLVLL